MSVFSLIALLADGKAQHVAELAKQLSCLPHQLNTIWQQAPLSIRHLLRQRDGWWYLTRPVAWFDENYQHSLFSTTVYHTVSSSNDVLLHRAKHQENIHQSLVVANTQENGRGRQGKTWHADAGSCLLFSVGWTFSQSQAQLGALSAVVALACHRALNDLDCRVAIKWPNDLMYGEQKLAGILIETVHHNAKTHAVIGIGLNFMQPENSKEAIGFHAFSREHSAQTVLNHLLNHLHDALQQFSEMGFAPFQAAYLAAQRDLHQEVVLLHNQNIVKQGTMIGIAPDGALLLQQAHSVEKITSGELSLRLPAHFKQPEHSISQDYLLFDAGNSRLKWAWINNNDILRTNHAPYRDLSLLKEEWTQYASPSIQVAGSAVCGDAKKALIQNMITQNIQWLGSMPRAMNIINHYRHPSEHGADRWFNALGSRRFSQHACVIISCGTAVTIDALTFDNQYLGGSIMPGFHLMRESLAQKTAQLQRTEGAYYPFPTTTANAITTGIMDAVCGAIMLMHQRLKQRTPNQTIDIIITGGGAAKIAKTLPETFLLDNPVKIIDNLVIYGLLDYLNHTQHTQRNHS